MRELGLETVTGTPGTSAALTLSAVTSPVAFPRLSDVGPVGAPIHYIIESSTGQPLAEGVGHCTGAGAFNRDIEFSQWNGTAYTQNPTTLYSLPAGCVIYCGAAAFSTEPTYGPQSNVNSIRWYEPGDKPVSAATYTPSTAGRDIFWRIRNRFPNKIDAVAIHTGAVGNIDLGIYEFDWATGNPGLLLAGWVNVTTVNGMNTLTLASSTLGIYAGQSSAPMPIGDLFIGENVSATAVTSGRLIDCVMATGSTNPDLTAAQPFLYTTRTQGTSFASNPTITGHNAQTNAKAPLIAFRGV